MYLLSVLAVILCFVLVQFMVPTRIGDFVDSSSILFLAVLVIPLMLSAGLLKDLNNAIRLVFGKKKDASLLELKRAKLAVDTMIKVSFCSSILVTMLELVAILHNMSDPAHLGPMISTTILTVLYAAVIGVLLLPVGAMLAQRILEYMPSGPAEDAEGQESLGHAPSRADGSAGGQENLEYVSSCADRSTGRQESLEHVPFRADGRIQGTGGISSERGEREQGMR